MKTPPALTDIRLRPVRLPAASSHGIFASRRRTVKTVTCFAVAGSLVLAAQPASIGAEAPVREAVTKAAQTPGHRPKLRAIYEVLAARDVAEFPAALDAIAALNPKDTVTGAALAYWMERDMEGARAWLDAHLGETYIYADHVCAAWVRLDLEGLVEWLESSEAARSWAIPARRTLFEALAREDPAAAAEWSLRMPKSGDGTGSHIYDEQQFFIEWARHDPPAAGARALEIPAGNVRLNALRGVMSGWGEKDRAGAAQWAEAIEDGALRRECAETLVRLDQIRLEHPLSGTEALVPAPAGPTLPPAPEMAAALNHASNMHVQHDYFALATRLGPEATFRALEAVWQHHGRRVFPVFHEACVAWADQDLAAFRIHVEQMTDDEITRAARAALVSRWQQKDAAAALAWANQLPPAERDSLLRSTKLSAPAPQPADPIQRLAKVIAEPGHFGEAMTILADWAKRDPAAASAHALAFTNDQERSMAISGVLRGWAEKDPAAALAWVRKLDAGMRSEASAALFAAWARRDIETALTTAQSLDDELRLPALGQIAPALFASNRDRALVLLETVPVCFAGQGYFTWAQREPEPAASALLGRLPAQPQANRRSDDASTIEMQARMIVRPWAGRDLAAAAAFVFAQPAPMRDRLCSEIVEIWMTSDPQAAVEWVFTLPDFDDTTRANVLSDAVSGWVQRGEKEAVAWVDALPQNPKRDAAVAALARAIMPHDAGAALTRLRTIRDPNKQREAFHRAWLQWSANDRDAAVRWRDAASLTPAERQILGSGP